MQLTIHYQIIFIFHKCSNLFLLSINKGLIFFTGIGFLYKIPISIKRIVVPILDVDYMIMLMINYVSILHGIYFLNVHV